jgi:hypothetical protein
MQALIQYMTLSIAYIDQWPCTTWGTGRNTCSETMTILEPWILSLMFSGVNVGNSSGGYRLLPPPDEITLRHMISIVYKHY